MAWTPIVRKEKVAPLLVLVYKIVIPKPGIRKLGALCIFLEENVNLLDHLGHMG